MVRLSSYLLDTTLDCFAHTVRDQKVSHLVPFVPVGWGRRLQRIEGKGYRERRTYGVPATGRHLVNALAEECAPQRIGASFESVVASGSGLPGNFSQPGKLAIFRKAA